MGTQNLNNFYFNRLDTKINYSSYYDLFLAADEKDFNQQVMYSNSIIDYDDGCKLPVWIDLNTTASTQPTTNCSFQYPTGATGNAYYTNNNYRPFVILSNNTWCDAKSMCECPYTGSGFTIWDAAWTGLDNGLFNLDDYQNGAAIDLFNNLPTSLTYDIYSYDKRFKMHQVKAFGFPWWTDTFYTDTSIVDATDYSGYYQELKGGFYQGFYKLYGYPYEVLPTRPECGWSFETYLKLNTICTNPVGPDSTATPHGVYGNCYNTSGWYLNNMGTGVITPLCSENPAAYTYDSVGPEYTFNYSAWNGSGMTVGRTDKYGFFFYKGVRAEDKWFHENMSYSAFTGCTTYTGMTGCCYECIETGLTGDTCNGQTGFTESLEDPVKLVGANKSPTAEYDVYSNAIGFRITDDMRIGYRTIRYTGGCQTTGETCNTGSSFDCGYTIEESYSDPICAFMTQSGDCSSNWIQVDVVFERNLCLEKCEIYNNGGVNDLVKVRTDIFQRYGSHHSQAGPFGCNPVPESPIKPTCNDEYPKFIEEAYFDFTCHRAQVQSWFDEKEYRMGTLTFYVNGRRVHKVENFEEIIPRQLNTNKQTQVGVAYNMSWGGGAMGLRESLIPDMSGCTTCCSGVTNNTANLIHWSGETDQRLIMENFAGSFIGGISQMMYYIKPLTPDEIYHNFKLNKNRYKLIDCEECKNCYDGCINCDIDNTSPPVAC